MFPKHDLEQNSVEKTRTELPSSSPRSAGHFWNLKPLKGLYNAKFLDKIQKLKVAT